MTSPGAVEVSVKRTANGTKPEVVFALKSISYRIGVSARQNDVKVSITVKMAINEV